MIKSRIITALCVGVSLFAFAGCNEPLNTNVTPTISANDVFQIVVDEDSLVQYIYYSDGTIADTRVAGLTVRMKADGTPYTIERSELDNYVHFSFDNTRKKDNT